MSDHEASRAALGSYLLGALGPAERSTLEAHLAGCSDCRDELAAYASLPGLMARLSAQEVRADRLTPPPALLPRTLAAVEAERAATRARLRRWRGLAVGVSAVAAAGLAAVLVLPGAGTPARVSAPARALVAAAGTSAAGTAELQGRAWGTQLHLTLHDLPREGTFTAWALDAAGSRTPAATWRATRDGRADVTGAAALLPAALSGLEIVGSDGARVLATS